MTGGSAEPGLVDTGFTEHAVAPVAREHAALLAATLDVDPGLLDTGALPLPWHWAFFPPVVATAGLGDDGHPRRRDEMSAFPLRMWVGGRLRSTRPLSIGRAADRASSVLSADIKDGSTGRFWLVTVAHAISQDGAVCIEEEQDLVLRGPSVASAPGPDAEAPRREWVEERVADPVLLFRYSALTFNSHRIHYDAPYATGVEHYPGVVVQGPLTATLLCDLAARRGGAPVRAADFRARVPLFAGRRFWLTGARGGSPPGAAASLAAIRADGETAMTLTATF